MQAIIGQFKTLYAARRWVRIAARVGLCMIGLALLATGGGFPPWAWRFLFQVISQLSLIWAQRGPAMLLPFLGLLLLALTLLLLWGCLALAAIYIVRDWLQRRRDMREFERELAQAGASIGAREAEWTRKEPSWSPRPVTMQSGQQARAGAGVGVISTMPAASVATVEAGSTIFLEVGTALDTGIKRKGRPNEDNLLALPRWRVSDNHGSPMALLIVADGMGGHEHGRDASRLAVTALHDALQLALQGRLDEENDDFYEELLAEGVHSANLAIYQRNCYEKADMGTTLTAALVAGNVAYIANVGDSRTYLYREGEGLSQITRDHSAVARLVEIGAITPREVYTHPKRNEVYRNLGHSAAVKVDTYSVPLAVGDLLLLCSDGLWEMVYDEDIEQIIASWLPTPSHICDALLQAALRGGGKDNISIIAAQVKSC